MHKLRLWLSADRVAALVFLCVFAAYGFFGSQIRSALSVDVVGPGFFPTVVGIIGAGLAIVLLASRKADDEPLFEPDIVALAPVALLLLYVVSLPIVGFLVATPIFLTVGFRFLGCPSWLRAVIYAVLATAAAYLLFHTFLEVRLPTSHLLDGVRAGA